MLPLAADARPPDDYFQASCHYAFHYYQLSFTLLSAATAIDADIRPLPFSRPFSASLAISPRLRQLLQVQ